MDIQTADLNAELLATLTDSQVHQIYNGLDTALTLEIFGELIRLRNSTPGYNFSRALQAPILEMMLRGFKVDEGARVAMVRKIGAERDRLNITLAKLAQAAWDKPLNPRSPKQLIDFFYGCMKLPEIWVSKKGEKKLSMGRDVLEKLELYFYARPFVNLIMAIRDRDKQLQFLETEIDDDRRYRTSYNIAGTETFRLSSSESAFGTGGNAQNVSPAMRRVLCADQGFKLCVMDLEQAESREVGLQCGLLFNDWTYLDACEGGDLHTLTCKLIWPSLPWPGDAKGDRALADGNFYRDYSYRDISKRGGHGSNYYGQPYTIAKNLKVPTKLAQDFQDRYFGAFSAIPKWHRWVANQIQTVHSIENAFGISRDFFGRPNDDTTLREAIAHGPQSSTGMRTNLVLWRIWKYMGTRVQLLAQTHDSISFQYREDDNEAEILAEAIKHFSVKLKTPSGRIFDVPTEPKTGWNWGNWDPKKNPNGLKKMKGPDTRKRLLGIDDILP
jgi:DNA polymerase I-like protein with 3'-5' exonuclease and polymerase domains